MGIKVSLGIEAYMLQFFGGRHVAVYVEILMFECLRWLSLEIAIYIEPTCTLYIYIAPPTSYLLHFRLGIVVASCYIIGMSRVEEDA